MKITPLLYVIILSIVVCNPLFAKKKSRKPCITLVEAYSQRTLPGVRRPAPPPPAIHIIVVWENTAYPDSVFWRQDTGMVVCNVSKAHKTINNYRLHEVKDYSTEITQKTTIHKGDTLDLVPMPSIKVKDVNHMPVTTDKNTLFFKTSDNNWSTFHIDTIKKKRDIAMP